MNRPTLYLIGDFTDESIALAIQSLPGEVDTRYFVSVDVALDTAANAPAETIPQPHVIVLAQPRPGQVRATAVERLHAVFPLARLVLLLGPWCEGEMRTGHPLGGIQRVFWHAFPEMISRLTAELRAGKSLRWAFPRIAGEQERVLQEIPFQLASLRQRQGTVIVRAADLITFESYAAALEPRGYSCAWLNCGQLARYREGDCLLWDAPRLDPIEWHLLAEARHRLAATPMLLATGFPRREDRSTAKGLGIERLLAKPFLVDDLLTMLATVIEPAASQHVADRAIAG